MSKHKAPHLFDREPPHSVEAERAVLGAILINPAAAATASAILPTTNNGDSGPFYVPAHQQIYNATMALHADGQPPELVTVIEHLRATGQLDLCGGVAAVAELSDAAHTSANIEHYARIVAESWRTRETIAAASQLQTALYSADYAAADKARTDLATLNNNPVCAGARFETLPADFLTAFLPPQETLFDNMFPIGYVSTLIGPPGLGKSWFVLMAATALSTGAHLSDVLIPSKRIPQRVVYLTVEDKLDVCQRRIQSICRWHGLTAADAALVCQNLHLYCVPSFSAARIVDGVIVPTKDLAWFAREVATFYPAAIFLDPAANLIGALNENDNAHITAFMALIRSTMPVTTATVIVHHTAKTDAESQSGRGASAWTGSARQSVAMRRLIDKERDLFQDKAYIHLAVITRKTNLGQDQDEPFYFRRILDDDSKNHDGRGGDHCGGVLVDARIQHANQAISTATNYKIASVLPRILPDFEADGGVTLLELRGKSEHTARKATAARLRQALSDACGTVVTVRNIAQPIKDLLEDGTLGTLTDSDHRQVLKVLKTSQTGPPEQHRNKPDRVPVRDTGTPGVYPTDIYTPERSGLANARTNASVPVLRYQGGDSFDLPGVGKNTPTWSDDDNAEPTPDEEEDIPFD